MLSYLDLMFQDVLAKAREYRSLVMEQREQIQRQVYLTKRMELLGQLIELEQQNTYQPPRYFVPPEH